MKNPETGKRLVALSAAVAIGFGGVALTGPAIATNDVPDDLGAAASTALKAGVGVAAVGYNSEGDIAVQVVKDSEADVEAEELSERPETEQIAAFAEAETGNDPVVTAIEHGYTAASASDVAGGAGYIVGEPGDQGVGLCSFGFPATGPDGEEAIITAGHCAEEDSPIYLEQPSASNAGQGDPHGEVTTGFLTEDRLGTFTFSAWADTTIDPDNPPSDWNDPEAYDPASTMDYGVITVNDDSLTTHPEVTDWTTAGSDDLYASTNPVAGVSDVTMDDIGNEMWRSGRTSAVQEGTVGGENDGVIGDIVDGYSLITDPETGHLAVVHGFAAEALSIPGDSGGAVMMGDQAVGVVSGTNYRGEGDGGDWTWVAELDEALNHIPGDYEVKTTGDDEDPSPTPTATEDPTEDPTETPDPTDDPTETPDPTPTATDTGEPTETPDPTPTDTESPDPTPTDTESPDPTETATDDPTTPAPTPTETEDADEDAELTVDPREIAAEQFLAEDEDQAVEQDRGVTYSVTGVEPGSEVTFDTYASTDAASANAGSEEAPAEDSDDAPAKSVTVTADEDGNASSRVWGLPSAPAEAYIGDYEVVVTTEEDTLEGSFEVVGEDGGDGGQDDGDEGDNGGDGDDLPRTGSTTGPLAAGAAGLVALGGALVYVARRRRA